MNAIASALIGIVIVTVFREFLGKDVTVWHILGGAILGALIFFVVGNWSH